MVRINELGKAMFSVGTELSYLLVLFSGFHGGGVPFLVGTTQPIVQVLMSSQQVDTQSQTGECRRWDS